MQTFISIEMAAVNRQVVLVVDGGVEVAERLATELRSLDPNAKELWRIEGGVAHSADKVMYCLPSPRAILDDLRSYIGSEKSRTAASKFIAAGR